MANFRLTHQEVLVSCRNIRNRDADVTLLRRDPSRKSQLEFGTTKIAGLVQLHVHCILIVVRNIISCPKVSGQLCPDDGVTENKTYQTTVC